ncbi:hypothetical protein ACPA9J_23460 [Pseudomonas aeruginosa]
MSAHLINVRGRNPKVGPAEVEDVIWGCVSQTLEQGWVHRAHGVADDPDPAHQRRADRQPPVRFVDERAARRPGDGRRVAMYVRHRRREHMGHVGHDMASTQAAPVPVRRQRPRGMMGLTAEILSKMHGISREAQDKFGARSHQLA